MSLLLFADLLTVTAHSPTPEPAHYDKTDGQWYAHDGVDVKETQQRRGNHFLLILHCIDPVFPIIILSTLSVRIVTIRVDEVCL